MKIPSLRPYFLPLGHFVTDINQGALPALLPFLIQERGLDYSAAGTLVFMANMASSLIQPVFGHVADRFTKPILLPAGILLAGAGLAMAGWVDQYWLLLCLAALSGVGIAAFHPEGARLTNRVSGDKKATAMSIFSVGGNLGFAVGPALMTGAILNFGMRGTAVLIVPVAVMALVFLANMPFYASVEREAKKKVSASDLKDDWWSFSRLILAVVSRAVMFFSLNTFLPLYWINVLGQSKAAGAAALSIMSVSGIFGTLIGGRLADRFGAKFPVVLGFSSLIVTLPLFLVFKTPLVLDLLLVPIGLGLYVCFSPMVVLGQRFLPNRVGLASGVTLGLAISVGGMVAPLLGHLADLHGLWWTMAAIAFVPPVSVALALSLPRQPASAK